MYGDSDVVRKHAARLRDQGEDIRVLADHVVALAETLHWEGRAADAMRERVRERSARLREAATRHDTAADSLDHLGREVDGLKDSIRAAERRADAFVADGGHVAVEQPPPGHKDWLRDD